MNFQNIIEKIKKFIDELIAGYKQMFSSNQNIKLVLVMVLAVFVVLFTAFGGCSGGSSCGGCGGCGGESSCSDGESCSSSGGKGYFKGEELAMGTVYDEYLDTAITLTYPSSVCTFSSESGDMWASWVGEAILAYDGRFAIQPEIDYASGAYNSAAGVYATNGEEAVEYLKATGLDQNDACGYIEIGEKTAVWREYGGYITIYMAVDHNPSALAVFYLIPYELDQNASDSAERAIELVYDEELRAILSAVKITSVSEIPTEAEAVFVPGSVETVTE